MQMWLVSSDDARLRISADTRKHSSYIDGLLDGIGDAEASVDIVVPFADAFLLKKMADFLEHHLEDDIVDENWRELPPHPLSEWDHQHLCTLNGMQLTLLMKSYNFLGCQLGLNTVGAMIGYQIMARDERGLAEFFGQSVPLTYSKEQLAAVERQFREPFR